MEFPYTTDILTDKQNILRDQVRSELQMLLLKDELPEDRYQKYKQSNDELKEAIAEITLALRKLKKK